MTVPSLSYDPFAAVRCPKCKLVHWPQLPCLKDVRDLAETGLVGALEARGETDGRD